MRFLVASAVLLFASAAPAAAAPDAAARICPAVNDGTAPFWTWPASKAVALLEGRSVGLASDEALVRLDRFGRIAPAGAVAGSELRVEVRNEIEILVQPTGL